MIDSGTIIKIVRSRGHKSDWPEWTNAIIEKLGEMKLGFPGIGNDHLSLVTMKTIEPGEIFIWDPYLYLIQPRGDEAPYMLKSLESGEFLILGIGCGIDSIRDPDRNIRVGDIIKLSLGPDDLVCRVDVRPTLQGGPGYYYFFKSYRDFRY